VGTIEKAGAGRAGFPFFYQIPLIPHPLFRSFLLNESLEQAIHYLNPTTSFAEFGSSFITSSLSDVESGVIIDYTVA